MQQDIFYVIVNEAHGLYLVDVATLTVDLIPTAEVKAAAKLFGVMSSDKIEVLYEVAGKLGLASGDWASEIEKQRASGTVLPVCVGYRDPVRLFLGRGHRVSNRGDRAAGDDAVSTRGDRSPSKTRGDRSPPKTRGDRSAAASTESATTRGDRSPKTRGDRSAAAGAGSATTRGDRSPKTRGDRSASTDKASTTRGDRSPPKTRGDRTPGGGASGGGSTSKPGGPKK